jgi:hypothetical protein
VYRAGFASQKTRIVVLDGDVVFGMFDNITEARLMLGEETLSYLTIEEDVTADPVEHCLHTVKMQLQKIRAATGAKESRLFLTGGNSFREKIATVKPYKGNRDRTHRPVHYDAIREYMEKYHGAVVVDEIEADDALCMEQHAQPEGQSVIVSLDKDLDMVPGWHYNYVNQEFYYADVIGKLWWANNSEYRKLRGTGLKWFYAQLIMGDSTDNIQGVPKKGMKAAFEAIDPCADEFQMMDAVRPLYRAAYGADYPRILREMGELLWLRSDLHTRWFPGSGVTMEESKAWAGD